MAENKVVWSTNDSKRLSALVDKYAPNGVRSLTSEVESLNTAVRAAEDAEGRDAARRAFWQSHQRITDADMEALRTLHQKACQSRRIESEAITTLDYALAQGLIGESEYSTRVYGESNKVLTEVRRRALDLIGVMDECAKHATFGSTASDAEKKAAMDAFTQSDAWSQTLTRFKAVYAAADAERKGELRAQHPELFESAIGR